MEENKLKEALIETLGNVLASLRNFDIKGYQASQMAEIIKAINVVKERIPELQGNKKEGDVGDNSED